jgi:ribosome maturation factor RimP
MDEAVVVRVWQVAEPLVTHEHLEIVDVEFRRERQGMVLRLYLDREGGTEDDSAGVGLSDLEAVSRQLGDLLDVAEAVPGTYTLEVSSPGIDRRLRVPAHFRRYIGRKVRVKMRKLHEGRRSFLGTLQAVANGDITVQEAGSTYVIPFVDIARANYEPEA